MNLSTNINKILFLIIILSTSSYASTMFEPDESGQARSFESLALLASAECRALGSSQSRSISASPTSGKRGTYDDKAETPDLEEASRLEVGGKRQKADHGPVPQHEKNCHLSPETRQSIIDALETTTASQREIAQNHNVSQSTVNRIRKNNSIERPKGSRKARGRISAETRQSIIKALETTTDTLTKIAQDHGVSLDFVKRTRKKYNTKRPGQAPKGRSGRIPPGKTQSIIYDLEMTTDSLKKIAKKHGVSHTTVRNIRNTRNIKRPKGAPKSHRKTLPGKHPKKGKA